MRSAARVRIPPSPPRRRKRYAACGGFFIKNHRRAHFAASPFPKKGILLACKRVCDASAFCQPFSGTNSPSENAEISFLCAFHILTSLSTKKARLHRRWYKCARNGSAALPLFCVRGNSNLAGYSKGKRPETPWFRAFLYVYFFKCGCRLICRGIPISAHEMLMDAPLHFSSGILLCRHFCRRFIG